MELPQPCAKSSMSHSVFHIPNYIDRATGPGHGPINNLNIYIFTTTATLPHDGVITWKHFPRYWPFVRSTGHRWVPLTQASDTELWWFHWFAPEQTVEHIIETPVIWVAIALIVTSPKQKLLPRFESAMHSGTCASKLLPTNIYF